MTADAAADAWTAVPSLPTWRSMSVATALDGRFRVIGGSDGTRNEHEVLVPACGP